MGVTLGQNLGQIILACFWQNSLANITTKLTNVLKVVVKFGLKSSIPHHKKMHGGSCCTPGTLLLGDKLLNNFSYPGLAGKSSCAQISYPGVHKVRVPSGPNWWCSFHMGSFLPLR